MHNFFIALSQQYLIYLILLCLYFYLISYSGKHDYTSFL